MDLQNWEYFTSGAPVSGATVTAYDASLLAVNPNTPLASTTTNSEGRWSFTGLSNGSKDVSVVYAGRTKWYKGLTKHSVAIARDTTYQVPNANLLRNGGLDSWPNGTSFVNPTSAVTETAEFVKTFTDGSHTLTISREGTIIAPDSHYSYKAVISSLTGTLHYIGYWEIPIELMYQLRGREVTFSIQVRQSVASACAAFIWDGVTKTTGTTNATVGSFITLSATKTISASASIIQFGVNCTLAGTYYLEQGYVNLGPEAGTFTPHVLDMGPLSASVFADGSISTVKIGDGQITTAKLADGAVTNPKLADGSVTTTKITDLAVSAAKLADGSVIDAKISTSAVSTTKIADGAVTAAKLASGAGTLPAGSVLFWNAGAVTIPSGYAEFTSARDRFFVGANSSYAAGSTGGATTHSHTVNNHTHSVNSHGHTVNGHIHTVDGHAHVAFGHGHSQSGHSHATNISHAHNTSSNTGTPTVLDNVQSGGGDNVGGDAHRHSIPSTDTAGSSAAGSDTQTPAIGAVGDAYTSTDGSATSNTGSATSSDAGGTGGSTPGTDAPVSLPPFYSITVMYKT